LAKFAAIGAGGYQIVGKPLIGWLVTNYPTTFQWLESVAHFLLSK
jgi:hypothetical protein